MTTRLPPHCRFQGTEIPKHLPYSLSYFIKHGQTHKVMALQCLPESILFGCRYRLELYSDPSSLRQLVPGYPGFPSNPCRITTTSAAHLSGREFYPFEQPSVRIFTASNRTGLAQLPVRPCPCRPIPHA